MGVKLDERIQGFVRLDDTSSLYQPPARGNVVASLQNKQREPQLLVFCSWMSAAPKHIAKYTAEYQRLLPNTTILLVEAKLTDMFIGNDLAAASKLIGTYINNKPPLAHRSGPSILLHASSNGGGNNAANLAMLLKDQGYAAPFDAVTMDCSPGKGELHSAARAVRLSIPNTLFLRPLGTALIYFLLTLYMTYTAISRTQDIISRLRTTLVDRAALGVNVPRLYLYSRADALVEAAHVHEHAVDAANKGCGGGEVVEEVFERAPHCALLNEDAGRYWAAVEKHARTANQSFAESHWGGLSAVGY